MFGSPPSRRSSLGSFIILRLLKGSDHGCSIPVVCIQNILNLIGIEINERLYPTGEQRGAMGCAPSLAFREGM